MKLSITMTEDAPALAPFVLRGKYKYSIQRAAEIGYDAVEFHVRNPDEVNQQDFMECCLKNKIFTSSLGTGMAYGKEGLSLSSRDAQIRSLAVDRIKSHISFAKKLGSVVIVGLIRGLAKENDSYKNFELFLTESLNRCIESAEKENVTIVLEAINRYECDNLITIESQKEFINKFDTDKLKIHIDTFHMNIEEDHIEERIIEAGKLIGHVHFADSNRMYPGMGHYDFAGTIKALKTAGYGGCIAMECLPLPAPDEAAVGAYNFVRSIL